MNFIAVVSFVVFLLYQSQGIPAGDSGDLVTAAATFGVPHPPGYPLYTFVGWLLNFIPLFTPAWRVALLSSVTHAVTLYFIGKIVYRLTKSRIASYFAQSILLGNYLFFLYSITPEVFALLDLFIVALLWYYLEWIRTKSQFYLYLLCVLFGLSLTHHHVILFFVPAVFWSFFQYRSKLRVSLMKAFGWFMVGLTPYVYVLFPPYGSSVLIWNPAVSFSNVVRLISRADYGTFQSASVFGQLPIQRLLNVQAYFQYVFVDFLWIGCAFAIIGLYTLMKRHARIGMLFLLGIFFLGPIFLFYASFPLVYRFSLGTFERFLLPSYLLIVISISVGYAACIQGLRNRLKRFRLSPLLLRGVSIVLFLYPVIVGYSTVSKFQGYSMDKTAENLAEDILLSIPENSIVLVNRDTVLFTTQYVRYARQKRPDLIVIHASKLALSQQRNLFKKTFPDLVLPPDTSTNGLADFIKLNAQKHRVFSYTPFDIGRSWVWAPHGLVYALYPESSAPSEDSIVQSQRILWNSLHDPSKGILSVFNHLLLADVRDIYTTSRTEYGKKLLKIKKFTLARDEFLMAIRYGGDSMLADAYMYKGVSEMYLKNCNQAVLDFEEANRLVLAPVSELLYFKAINYRDCFSDQKKYDELYVEYQKLIENKQTKLQSL